MEGDDAVIVGFLVEFKCAALDQVVGHFADMLRRGIAWVKLLLQGPGKRVIAARADADQRVPEAVGNPPGMAAFAHHNALDAQLQSRITDAHGGLAHVRVIADEHAEVARLGGVRAERPADSGGMKYLGIADQAFHMRLGEEISRWGDQQHFRAFRIERQLHFHPGVGQDVFLQAGQRVFQGRAGQSQVVADTVQLAKNFVGVFLPQADAVHDLARRHGDFRGVDAIRTVHRAAAAFGALVKIAVPIVEHFLGEVLRSYQRWEMLAGEGVIAPIDLAQQLLPGNWHVFGVAASQVVVAFVGAGAAVYAGVQINLEGAVFGQQIAQLGYGLFLPVFHQRAGEAERLLDLWRSRKRLDVRHRTLPDLRDVQVLLQLWHIKFWCSHIPSWLSRYAVTLLCLFLEFRRPRRQVPFLARVVNLIAGRAEEHARRVQQFTDRK